jgi:nucleoside-diphosphate-sugar epimerase
MGESLCHAAHRVARPVRVVRLSNVVGPRFQANSFIGALLREAVTKSVIDLNSRLDCAKDYIALADVTQMLPLIARQGQACCYNLASGQALTHQEVIQRVLSLAPAQVRVAVDAPCSAFPPIEITRLKQTFDFQPTPALNGLAGWLPIHEH